MVPSIAFKDLIIQEIVRTIFLVTLKIYWIADNKIESHFFQLKALKEINTWDPS